MKPSPWKPVPFTRVKIQDRFWAPRIRANREQTLPVQYEQCRKTGRLDAFKVNWKPGLPNEPHIFWDSDVAKWVEAASYSLATHPDATLERQLDEVIALIAGSQQADGYLNSHYTAVEPTKRWTNLRDCHELYCAGHLIEAAVAHFEATGKRTLLDAMCRYADYIGTVFGRRKGQKRGYCGHEEIELALVKLACATGQRRYLELAQYFIDERGRRPYYFDVEARARGDDPARWPGGTTYAYCQADRPVREQSEVTGHAVRAMYLYSAMADLAADPGDPALRRACERLWRHATEQLMYVTGALGSSRHNEGFTFNYDLPNETAYAETCASIAYVFWNHRLLHLEGDGRFADVLERALYNGVIAGVSLDGTKFFYENPLASMGRHHRQDWFGCACCPPNVARLLASLGQYVYSEGPRGAAVHLYVEGEAELTVAGNRLRLVQKTDYPWDGRIDLAVEPERPAAFVLKLRVPGWCPKAAVKVNGKTVRAPIDKGYLALAREWRTGDRVTLDLAMPIQRVYATPRVRMDCGRVALQRGPLVYCLEGVDNGSDLNALALARNAKFTAQFEPGLLGGVVTLTGKAERLVDSDWNGTLYRAVPPKTRQATIRAVPYAAWDNRAPGEMLVWLRERVT